jgi:hypothetical protein
MAVRRRGRRIGCCCAGSFLSSTALFGREAAPNACVRAKTLPQLQRSSFYLSDDAGVDHTSSSLLSTPASAQSPRGDHPAWLFRARGLREHPSASARRPRWRRPSSASAAAAARAARSACWPWRERQRERACSSFFSPRTAKPKELQAVMRNHSCAVPALCRTREPNILGSRARAV